MTIRLLLDSHVVVPLLKGDQRASNPTIRQALELEGAILHVSAASLWEIAIKVRLGKLQIDVALAHVPEALTVLGVVLLAIDHRHALMVVDPEPPTRDPFDRLLLAQCAVENLRLVTLDRALVDHPLAYRPR